MIKRLLPLLFLVSCQTYQGQQTSFHDDGRAKPKLALVEFISSCQTNLPWDVSQELHQSLFSQLRKTNQIYLMQSDKFSLPDQITSKTVNPFHDHSWLIYDRPIADYIALLELVEHIFIPRSEGYEYQKLSGDLHIKVRVKILDVRSDKPRVVLQEIIHQSTYVPAPLSRMEYKNITPEKSRYSLTPAGIAHNKMIKKTSQRIRDYVLLSHLK